MNCPAYIACTSSYGINSLRPSGAYSKLTIFGLDNGLSLGRFQAIIWTNDGILLIQWNFSWKLNISIQGKALQYVCEMAAILSPPEFANTS